MNMLHDQVKQEICRRCEFSGATTLDGKVCARTGAKIVAMVADQFTQRPDVAVVAEDEEVTVSFGGGVTFRTTKEVVIDGLATAMERMNEQAGACTSDRSWQFLRGTIDDFAPTVTYTRDELMASISAEL